MGREALSRSTLRTGMPFNEHLRELRKRITRIVILLGIATAVSFVFHQEVLNFLMKPATEFTSSPGGKPIFTDPTEFIGVAMKVSLLGGLVLTLPVILYEAIMFAAPGLTRRERRYLIGLLPVTLLAFIAGGAFGYVILFPPAFKFLLTFGADVASAMIRIGPLVDLVVRLLVWMGLVFELPILLFFLTKIGLVTPNMLSKYRPYALVMAFVLGALITPTMDPINQALVALPIMFLYEVGIWLSKLAKLGSRGQLARRNTPDE